MNFVLDAAVTMSWLLGDSKLADRAYAQSDSRARMFYAHALLEAGQAKAMVADAEVRLAAAGDRGSVQQAL